MNRTTYHGVVDEGICGNELGERRGSHSFIAVRLRKGSLSCRNGKKAALLFNLQSSGFRLQASGAFRPK